MQSRCYGAIVEHKFLCCQEENGAGKLSAVRNQPSAMGGGGVVICLDVFSSDFRVFGLKQEGSMRKWRFITGIPER
jgi:hypothetical protein